MATTTATAGRTCYGVTSEPAATRSGGPPIRLTPQAVTTVSNLDWYVAGSGDYNGDGQADILWRNIRTGANTIWRSANSATRQGMFSVKPFVGWRVAGSGDYNGDGVSDVLWRNRTARM